MTNLSRWIFSSVVCALASGLGCGDAQEDIDTAGDEIELGELDQKLTAQLPSYGAANSASKLACNSTSASQTCLVPRENNMLYCYQVGITEPERIGIDAAVAAFNARQAKFRFTRTNVTADGCSSLNSHVLVRPGVCSGSSASSNKDAYVCWSPLSGQTLSESVPGAWISHGGAVITVDQVDLSVKGAAQNCVTADSAVHAFAGIAGLGTRTESDTNAAQFRITHRQIDTICLGHTLTDTEVCAANNYNKSSPGTFAFSDVAHCGGGLP